jgi:hypothetical protein
LIEYDFPEPDPQDREDACLALPEIYPGVHGSVVIRGTVTFINEIWAKAQGSGQVGKYLDSLQGTVIVDSVLSPRLRGMLERRGYQKYGESGMQKGVTW